MKGRSMHELKTIQNTEYLRKKIGVVNKYSNQYLTNTYLRGEVDEVFELNDGTMAPLDYKFAEYKDTVFETYKTQLICYALLIEENYGRPVEKGFLVYTRSANKLIEIPISMESKARVKPAADAIEEIISKNYYPKSTKYKKRCVDCTYKKICIQ